MGSLVASIWSRYSKEAQKMHRMLEDMMLRSSQGVQKREESYGKARYTKT